jgi:hypothetical protein
MRENMIASVVLSVRRAKMWEREEKRIIVNNIKIYCFYV